jgi:hypothetical protein
MKKTLQAFFVLSALFAAATGAQAPPCSPCAGIIVDDPLAVTAALAAAPALEGEARLYLAWPVELSETASQAEALQATTRTVAEAGATPWLRLIFRTPSPILEHGVELARELTAAAAVAAQGGERTHLQILWQPSAGTFGPVEYAYLLKRASVAVVGARPGARVLTAALDPRPETLTAFYGEEVAAYLDGVALRPASPEVLIAAAAQLAELDPGRPVILDAAAWPAEPWSVLADAARADEWGLSLTLFQVPAEQQPLEAQALAPLKVLAREFQGDLSLDPSSRPTGAAEAWSFVRGEDLSLRVIARRPAGTESLQLTFPDPQLKRPAQIDTATGEVQDLFGQRRTETALEVDVDDAAPVTLLRLERMSAAELAGVEGVEEKLTVEGERQMPVEEILRRLQAFDDAQNRRYQHFRATNTTHLRFQFGTGVQSLEATFEGGFFFRQGEGYDWAWETFYINGVRWRGKTIPEIPLVQPEKAAARPLEIHFTKEYSYRLRGTEVVDGRDCWVVDFSPAVAVEPGRTLFQGTVWIDREHFGRVRTRALQLGLEGEVLSNEETVSFTPVLTDGSPGPWTPESLWLPLRSVGQRLLNILNATTVVEQETLLTALEIDGAGFEEQRQAALASDVTMVRDTDKGVRYLVKDETGERVVQEGFSKSRRFLVAGVFYDESQDYPLPLGGIDYFSFDFRGTGKQVNIFFAGPLLVANIADPNLFGSKWDAGANLFALGIAGTDTVFRNNQEVVAEEVKSRPTRFSFFLGHPLGSRGKLDLTYSLRHTDFSRSKDAAEEFLLPQDHFVHVFQVETRYNRSGFRMKAEGSYNQRSDWQAWGLPGSAERDAFDPDTEQYTLWKAAVAKTWWLPSFQKFGIELEYLDGQNLDRFSKYEFGFFSDSRVHGYQSGRVRATQALGAHVSYGFELGELMRLQLIGDAVQATDEEAGLKDELLAGIGIEGTFLGPWSTVVNLDLGFALAGPDDGYAVFLTFLKLFK